jgi:hypothetical protein
MADGIETGLLDAAADDGGGERASLSEARVDRCIGERTRNDTSLVCSCAPPPPTPPLPPPLRGRRAAVAPAVLACAPPSPASPVHPSPAEEPARGGSVGERAGRRVRQPPLQQEGAAVERRDRGVHIAHEERSSWERRRRAAWAAPWAQRCGIVGWWRPAAAATEARRPLA